MAIQDEVKVILRQEMDARGYHNNDYRAGLAAIIGGESRFIPTRETGYSHTSNSRIRQFFSKARPLSDAQLNEIKKTDRSWFNFVYGGRFGNRPGTDDGFDYRGGGLNQLTFRGNYKLFGPKVGVDLVTNPELITVPRVAAAVAVEFMIENFHGGDFSKQKAAVGVSMGEPDDVKNELYALYTRTGEWDYVPGAIEPRPTEEPKLDVGPEIDPIIAQFVALIPKAESVLKAKGLYTGPLDFDPGPGFRAALKAYLANPGD